MSDNISQNPPGSGIPEKSSGSKASDSESCKVEGLEEAPGNDAEFVDKATERAVVRKLDYRIIPMVMWVYLMNMMDRGAFLFWLPPCGFDSDAGYPCSSISLGDAELTPFLT